MNLRSSDLVERFPGIHRLLRVGFGRNGAPSADERLIAKELRRDFFPKYWLENRHDWAARFLETWRSGLELRKPFPGFHPGIYRDHHSELKGDPTIAFLKERKPEGPWLTEVISESKNEGERGERLKVKGEPSLWEKARWTAPKSPPDSGGTARQGGGCRQSDREGKRVHVMGEKGKSDNESDRDAKSSGTRQAVRAALHLHLHYPEQAGSLFRALNAARLKPDLFISVTSEGVRVIVKGIMEKHGMRSQRLEVFPNRGRDLGPFLTGFRDSLLRYEVVGHFHTKQSRHAPSAYVKKWAAFLQDNLIGDNGEMVDSILSRFATDSTVGIVYPDDPIIVRWLENYSNGKALLERRELSVPEEKRFFNFPVGSMFWARAAAVKPLFELGLGWEDYPEEPIPQDGTILHAIERLLGVVPGLCGYRTLVTHVPGVGR
jgi:hypothetical protein